MGAEFNVGSLVLMTPDGSVIGKMEEIKSFEVLDCPEEETHAEEYVPYSFADNHETTFKCTVSQKWLRKLQNVFLYGWNSKGPVRKIGMLKAHRARMSPIYVQWKQWRRLHKYVN